MLTGLYLIIIKPIILFLEFLFSWLYFNVHTNMTATIAIISFIVSSLCLPFYLKAEKLQKDEKDIQQKMADKVNSIKKNYKGDEKYFLLQTCYRQNNYHPIMSLRLSLSLLLQIPFFIAAYTFFSHLGIFDGASALFVHNLAKPDNILTIGNFSINILPIIMTIISLAAGYIYVGNYSFKDNKGLILMSLVFLVLLYNSPAGLVLYWIFNNLFSYFKNLLLKYANSKIIFIIICDFVALFYYYAYSKGACQLSTAIIVQSMLFLLYIDFSKVAKKLQLEFSSTKLFYLSALFLWILMGILIPLNVFSSSPTEFLFSNKSIPYGILIENALQYFGLFIFWGTCIFYVLNKEEKKYFSIAYCILAVIALLNLHFWKLPNVPMVNNLTFNIANKYVVFNAASIPCHILYYFILLFVILFIFISIKKNKFVYLKNCMIILIGSMIVFAGNNAYKIIKTYNNYEKSPENYNKMEKLITLSRTKKNVVFFFIDRTVNSFFPMIVKEHPELLKVYKGFKYYPNTISFAQYSITGYLPMFGGYEYTPQHIDERKIDFLIKHNEAVSLLPVIFKQNGFDVNVMHPVNNAWWQDVSQNKNHKPIQFNDIFEKYSINVLMPPKFEANTGKEEEQASVNLTKRNLFYFCLMSVLPESSKEFMYGKGKYFTTEIAEKEFYDQTTVQGYMELYNLVNFTEISSDNNTFNMFDNWLNHYPNIFKLPDYELDEENPPQITANFNSPYFDDDTYKYYHTGAASYMLLGKWLEYLKKEGVYDNTRIIIVADHGYYLYNKTKDDFFNKVIFPINPILLVKDFNSHHDLKLDNYELMTNADAPFFAFNDLIDNPKNPFTGKPMTQEDKANGLYVKMNGSWRPNNYLDQVEVLKDTDIFGYIKNSDPMDSKNWRLNITKEQLKKELHQD